MSLQLTEPTQAQQATPEYSALVTAITDWEIRVVATVDSTGYQGGNSQHVAAILNALDQAGLKVVAK